MHEVVGELVPWWQRGVIYQVYPRSFADASGDGVGDLAGVIDRLDYLARTLGVEAIWLSPFYRSPMRDFGYDISDHTDVDPLFGDLATIDRLVSEVHRRGLKLIVDYVLNHTSVDHSWFEESRSSRESERRDWYLWRDPKPDGSAPNNWISVFGGPAWALDERTGQCYLHLFDKSMPDLNWRAPGARRAMLDVVRFWLDRDVDGFRIDVAHLIMKDPELRDNPPPAGDGGGGFHKPMGDYDSQLHLHDKAHPDVHGVYRELREIVDGHEHGRARVTIGDPRVRVGEVGVLLRRRARRAAHAVQLRAPEHGVERGRRARGGGRARIALPEGAWPNWVLGNHDESRVATRVGPAGARLAMMLRGTPTIYNGDELGMEDVDVPPELVRDPMELLRPGTGVGRDPARAPMPWTRGENAGFSPPGAAPWLPLPPDARRISVEAQLADPGSMLSLTRRLLALRRASPALAAGDYRELSAQGERCLCFLRESAGRRVLVALNFESSEQVLDLGSLGAGELLASTAMDRDGAGHLSRLVLRAQEGVVVRLAG